MPPTFVMTENATTVLLEAATLLSQPEQKPEDKQKLLDGSRGKGGHKLRSPFSQNQLPVYRFAAGRVSTVAGV